MAIRIAVLLLVGSLAACGSGNQQQALQTLYVGGYTAEKVPTNEGVYTVQFDPGTREMSPPVLYTATTSPSWLAVTEQGLYAVEESGAGAIHFFKDGKRVQTLPSEGAAPCHIAINDDGKTLVVSNYTGGSFAVFNRDPSSGLLEENPFTILHSSKGPNARQVTKPHVHWAGWAPGKDPLYIVDLGLDSITTYSKSRDEADDFDRVGSQLLLPVGAGPRQMVFHPNGKRAYILNELNNTLTYAELESNGDLIERQTISTLPADFKDHSQAAHIALSANSKNVYVSNRGHNSIAHIQLADDGKMAMNQWQNTQGDWPRFFLLLEDANTLLVANQKSNSLVALAIAKNGSLSETGQTLAVNAPTFIAPSL